MKEDYTHITVILDRTGSMEPIRDDIIGGFNAFLKEQKEQPGSATLTLVQFDSQDSYEVIHKFLPIAMVPKLTRNTFVPRASTPLLDTIGRGINDLEKCIGDLKKKDRPAKVILAVVTDGQENASVEFNKPQIEKMVTAKTAKDGWEFVFLSADLAAIGDANSIGIHADRTLLFAKDSAGSNYAWNSLSEKTSDLRSHRRKKFQFDESDRKRPDDPGKAT